MPEFQVISKTPYAVVNEKRELVEGTFVVYRDKDNHVHTIVIAKKAPTDSDITEAVKKRAGV